MKYSVVIPAFNAIETIGETLSSVYKQTIQPKSIYVVNDGNDKILSNFLKSQNVHVISSVTQLGPGGAKNLGVGAVTTEFFAILDADDLWGLDFAFTHQNIWKTLPADTAAVGGSFSAFGGAPSISFNSTKKRKKIKDGFVNAHDLLLRNPFTASSVMYRTEHVQKIGGWPAAGGSDDYQMYAKLSACSLKLYFSGQISGSYRIHSNQISINVKRQLTGEFSVLEFLGNSLGVAITSKKMLKIKSKFWYRALARSAIYNIDHSGVPLTKNFTNFKRDYFMSLIFRIKPIWLVIKLIWRIYKFKDSK